MIQKRLVKESGSIFWYKAGPQDRSKKKADRNTSICLRRKSLCSNLLSHTLVYSTIGEERLNCWVRDGIRCVPLSMSTKQTWIPLFKSSWMSSYWPNCHWLRKTLKNLALERWLSFANSFFDLYFMTSFLAKKKGQANRLISIGQLEHIAVLPPPTYLPRSLRGAWLGYLILREAWRLYAFNAYPFRT